SMLSDQYHVALCDHQGGTMGLADHPALPTADPAIAHAIAQSVDSFYPPHVGGAVVTLRLVPVAAQYSGGEPGADFTPFLHQGDAIAPEEFGAAMHPGMNPGHAAQLLAMMLGQLN